MEVDFILRVAGSDIIMKKPDVCPHCGMVIDPKVSANPTPASLSRLREGVHGESYLIPLALRCTACDRSFLSLYRWDPPQGQNVHRTTERIFVYPRPVPAVFHPLIHECSPEFVSLFKSAFAAESEGHQRLAAAGYRMALEQLVKDYLIREEGLDEANLKDMSLYDCIGDHLAVMPGLLESADVVRMLGNDYIHYARKYENINFDVLREYLDTFVHLVQMQLRLKHPPVARKQ